MFGKSICPICENEVGTLQKSMIKVDDENICQKCFQKLNDYDSNIITNIKKYSSAELKKIVKKIEKISDSVPKYVVLQVVLEEKLIGAGSANLTELENVINTQASKGYRLHTISTANGGSKGILGGDRIQATLVFERIN